MSREVSFSYYSELLEGAKQKYAGNFDAALDHYTRAMRIAPQQSVTYYEIATILALKNDFAAAVEYADKAVRANNQNYHYHILKAKVYQSNGMIDLAAKTYNDIIALQASVIEHYYDQANLYLAMNDTKSAFAAFDKAEKYFGVNEVINTEKFNLASSIGDYKRAYSEINKLIKAYPNDSRFRAMLAELYVSQGKYKQAAEEFYTLESMNVEHGMVFMSLAEFYRIQNDVDKVFLYLNKAFETYDIDIDSKIEILFNMIGSTNNHQFHKSVYSLLETLVTAHPDEPKAHTIYADYLVRDGRWDEARTRFNMVLKAEKSHYALWEQALYLDNKLEDWETMFARSTEALQYFPMQSMLYMFNTVSAIRLRKYSEAVVAASAGVKYSAGNTSMKVEFLTYLGESYHHLENHAASDSVFEELLKIDPENVMVLNNYSYYLSLRNFNLERALQLSSILISLKPDVANYLDTHAWVLFRRQQYNEALQFIEEAIGISGDTNPTIVEHYGDVLYHTGNVDRAVEMWQKALDLHSDSKTLPGKIEQRMYIE